MKLRKYSSCLQQRLSFLLNCCFHLLIFFWISVVSASSSSSGSLSSSSLTGADADLQLTATAAVQGARSVVDPVMLRLFESNMLKALGLKSRPRPDRSKITVSDPMLQLYYEQTGQNPLAHVASWRRSQQKLGRIADIVRSFHPSYGNDVSMMGHKEMMAFDMTSLPRDDDIKAAEVKIFIKQSWFSSLPHQDTKNVHQQTASDASRGNQRFIIRIYEVLQKSGQDLITRPLDSKLVDVSNQSRWVTFDILPAVQRWQLDPSTNLGLELEVTSVSGQPLYHEHFSPQTNQVTFSNPIRQRRSVPANSTTLPIVNSDKQPVMMVHSNDAKSKASKPTRRNQQRPTQGSRNSRNLCKRTHLYVDFADVQWTDWIVAPPGYTAYHCSGECSYPLPDHLNTTNHAVVQSLVHHANSANRGAPAAPNPCCVPTELSPISLLYVDEYDKIVLKNYQDMVVEGCGCR